MNPNRTVVTTEGTRAPWWRIANLVLGAWLFLSAFMWPHSAPSQTNTWIVGVAIMAFSSIAILVPRGRWLNAAAAAWLLCAALILPHATTTTLWNNVLVAIAVFLVSMNVNRPLSRHIPA